MTSTAVDAVGDSRFVDDDNIVRAWAAGLAPICRTVEPAEPAMAIRHGLMASGVSRKKVSNPIVDPCKGARSQVVLIAIFSVEQNGYEQATGPFRRPSLPGPHKAPGPRIAARKKLEKVFLVSRGSQKFLARSARRQRLTLGKYQHRRQVGRLPACGKKFCIPLETKSGFCIFFIAAARRRPGRL
jgi:hypothetical protein